ncbi:MAG: hypothetical protein EZS28_045826, partial [Streblomastix strix]
MYQLAKRIPDEARAKMIGKDSKILPILFAIVQHFSKYSEQLNSTMDSSRSQGGQNAVAKMPAIRPIPLGVSKVYEENDQSLVNISGGAN